MTRYAIVADLNRCVGCQTCTSACKHANATAPGIQWRKVLDFEVGEYPDVSRAFLPVGCMHCEDPPCMTVCPTTATKKRDDGIVTIDYDICIGCAYCAVACPYQARSRVDGLTSAFGGTQMRHEALREDPARIGVAQKCTLCVDRIDAGKAEGLIPGVDPLATPACVNSCIAGALHMGDLDDPDSDVSKLLRENRHFRMHEDLGTGPGIIYLYDKDIGDHEATEPVPMVADPVGLSAVSPKLQTSWDWRAAANFTFGGTGTGLFVAMLIAGFYAPTLWYSAVLALALVGAGLFCVWLEIGRPWRFLNVYFNARTSWMTREAMAAMPFFGCGAIFVFWQNPALGVIAAASGLGFLYCQGQILAHAKGIPAWRQKPITALMMVTGLTEGSGLLLILALSLGSPTNVVSGLAIALGVLVLLRLGAWGRYRAALGANGAPVATFEVLERPVLNLGFMSAAAILMLLGAGFFFTPLMALAGLMALASGWLFKVRLITKAAFNQGYAMNRMPARGAGKSSPGIQPGWRKA